MSWLRLMEESIQENEPIVEPVGPDLTSPSVHRKKQTLAGLITLSGNYFLKHFSLNDSIVQDPQMDRVPVNDLIQSVEFQNNVLLRVSNRNELLAAYISMDSLGSKLRTVLSGKIE